MNFGGIKKKTFGAVSSADHAGQSSSFHHAQEEYHRLQRAEEHSSEEGPSHADEGDANWIISYADMMTLLMAFFAIMYSFSKIDYKAFDDLRKEIVKNFGGQLEMPFDELDTSLQNLVKSENLSQKIKIDRDSGGLNIVFQGTMFFETGGVDIREDSLQLLNKILDILEQKAKIYPIFVEGHTDDAPISTSMFPSNWELSSSRASLVVRMLEQRGFAKDKLSAQGFADSRPIVPNRDNSGTSIPENQAQNRRVLIRVAVGK